VKTTAVAVPSNATLNVLICSYASGMYPIPSGASQNIVCGSVVACVQLEVDLRVLRHEIRQSGETGVQLPVNFRRLIWNAQKIFRCKPHRPGPSGVVLYSF